MTTRSWIDESLELYEKMGWPQSRAYRAFLLLKECKRIFETINKNNGYGFDDTEYESIKKLLAEIKAEE